MIKTRSQNTFLPTISGRSSEKGLKGCYVYNRKMSQMNAIKDKKANQISKLLKEVRESMKYNMEGQQSLQKQKHKKQHRKNKRQSFLTKKQKKVYLDEVPQQNQNERTSTSETMRKISSMIPNSLQVTEFKSMIKPPHRTKTAICTDGDKVYVYGGLGCEPNLKLAAFDIETKTWIFPTHEKFTPYHAPIPIVGHSFGCYRNKGYIYGGKSSDVMNELSIVNFRDLKFTEGERCQFRRKQHAMIMISKFMIIHGGISPTQVSNQMFFYNTQTNAWTYPVASPTLPYLMNHSMASTYSFKSKKKQITSFSQIADSIFIFGGQDKKGNLSNSLYKVSYQNDTFVAAKIDFSGNIWPQKRMQMAFHSIGSCYLLLYGGKKIEEDQDSLYVRDSCVYTYHTQKNQWLKIPVSQPLQEHYGMASAQYNGRIHIFGGIQNNRYTNGNITVLTTLAINTTRPKSTFGTRNVLTQGVLAPR